MKQQLFTYTAIPGRGLLTKSSIEARLNYLKEKGIELSSLDRYFLDYHELQNNIESFIGTVEIPVGIVGPLLMKHAGTEEMVYAPAGTLEGALVASMNRGAKAISMSGGFQAEVRHQRMMRVPMFSFHSEEDAVTFVEWIQPQFDAVKAVTQDYSNHAQLTELKPVRMDEHVHVQFVYTTGDASGQNMTTTCTWHAMLWMVEAFTKTTEVELTHFIIEGNGASDKKVSRFLIDQGRGCHVKAECFLEEEVIRKVLRTSSAELFRCFGPSLKMAEVNGMLAFNINVANAIAAIFVATGQDLASIHESGLGILELEMESTGLRLRLTLPSLVIGTVGGGTTLPDQNDGLKILGCAGSGKVERFARLIAGFALSLEISTYAAIVSGEFAKAHEKLGRNKPVMWLLRNELNEDFLKKCLNNTINGVAIERIAIAPDDVENGILTNVTKRVNKKIIGFIPVTVQLENNETRELFIKSKALDTEVIKGLHLMSASIEPKLADLIYEYRDFLEYKNGHLKELNIMEHLSVNGFHSIPLNYGNYMDPKREVYLLFQERLYATEMALFDSENKPEQWESTHIRKAIEEIHKVHVFYSDASQQEQLPKVQLFHAWNALPVYRKMIDIICEENDQPLFRQLYTCAEALKTGVETLDLPLTIIHNDFNPRNVAVRLNGEICIYDWELAVKNIPHRDIVEFLCFALTADFEEAAFFDYLEFHLQLAEKDFPNSSREAWYVGYTYALNEFLVTRASFYKVAEVLINIKFADRVMVNGLRMLTLLANR